MTIDEYLKLFPEQTVYRRPKYLPLIKSGMLLFDEETACNWGGPFDGNYAYFDIIDHSKQYNNGFVKKLKTEAELRHDFRMAWYAFPMYPKRWMENAQSEEHLQKRLAQLSQKELKEWQARQDNYKIDQPHTENPVALFMSGNDDTTYTKFFPNTEAALEEIALFEIDQPLNMTVHIINNDFVFTN